MLSYRHAFHAGNHADVLKHAVEIACLDYLGQKDKPYWYLDTHAGAGMYSLETGYATQNAEYESGIARLWDEPGLPPLLVRYVEVIRAINARERGNGKDGVPRALKVYPGSPVIADVVASESTKLRLFEMHPSDSPLLARCFKDAGRRALIYAGDGYEGLKALLPPPPRRALVLIDPSYEDKSEYARVVTALKDALKRFATGTYVLWYPQLHRLETRRLPDQLKALGAKSWLHVALTVRKPTADGFGMHGSGLFILNPPWVLAEQLAEVMPALVELLGEDESAGYTLEHDGL